MKLAPLDSAHIELSIHAKNSTFIVPFSHRRSQSFTLYNLCSLILGTHYIQDIFISNSTPGQISISCKFLVNNVFVPGFLAIIHSIEESDNVHYLVTQNSNQIITQGSLSNLGKGTYTIILYTIGNDGLPLRRAAGFPQNVLVTQEGMLPHTALQFSHNYRP